MLNVVWIAFRLAPIAGRRVLVPITGLLLVGHFAGMLKFPQVR